MYRVLDPNIMQDSKWFIYKCPNLDTFQVSTNKWYCELDYSTLWVYGHYKYSAPVTDKKTNKSYKNMFCARCYGLKDNDVMFWTPSIQANEPLLNSYFDLKELFDMIERFPEFNIVYIPPSDIHPETYTCIIKDCDKSGYIEYDQFVEHACLSYRSVYMQQFQNIFCAICSGRNIWHDNCDMGNDVIVDFFPTYFYIGILDFNSLDPPAMQVVDQFVPKCPNGYYWDALLNGCRELVCTSLSNLVVNRCELLFTAVKGYNLEVDLIFVTQEPTIPFTPANVHELYQNFTVNLNGMLTKSLANSSLDSFRLLTRFIIIPYFELEIIESGVYHFKETKILGFGLDISILSSKKSELTLLKELLQDAQTLFKIKSFEAYTIIDFMQFMNLVFSTANYNSSEIDILMNGQMEKLAAELDTAFASGNVSDKYGDNHNGTPDIPFDLLPEFYPDDYWYNYTTPTTKEMNDVTNDSREAISVTVPNKHEQNQSSGNTSYFHIGYLFYPRQETPEPSNGVLSVYSHLLCTLVKFNKQKTSMNGLEITIITTNITLNINEASLCDDMVSLCVCLEVYENAVRNYLSTNTDNNHGTSQQIRKTYHQEFITSVALSIIVNML